MKSKRSCCSPVTCCGMPIEKGCFIFAVINAILCAIIMLGGLSFMCLSLSEWLGADGHSPNDEPLMWLVTGTAIASCVGGIIVFIFAVLLCVGLKKSNTRYIMAYLVYGIIMTILSVAGIVLFVWMESGEFNFIVYALIPLGVCVIYSGLLVLVYRTHAALSARTPITSHRKLLSNDC